jgi:hypothetical protein
LSKRPVDRRGADPGDGADYKALYEKERARLTKLWDAYEVQEGELRALKEQRGDVEAERLSGAPRGPDGQAQDLERFAKALIKKEEQLLAREATLREASDALEREREVLAKLKAFLLERTSELESKLRDSDAELARLKARRR